MINPTAHAHPVIYKGGTMIGSENMSMYSNNQINYSFHQKWATGFNLWRFNRESDNKTSQFGLVRLNHLLKRWNTEDSQANIYLTSGIGVADSHFNADSTKLGLLGGFEGDWETRTLFTSLKYYQFNSPNLVDVSMTQARIGYSPYLADFDKLQSWVMLQGMYMRGVEKNVVVTPLVRFFYNNVLWEVGSSLRSEWFLNFMVHI
jgi:hypothetical protein